MFESLLNIPFHRTRDMWGKKSNIKTGPGWARFRKENLQTAGVTKLPVRVGRLTESRRTFMFSRTVIITLGVTGTLTGTVAVEVSCTPDTSEEEVAKRAMALLKVSCETAKVEVK